MNTKHSFYLKNCNTDCSTPIYLKVISNGKRFFYSTGIFINKKYWCKTSKSILKNCPEWSNLDNRLELIKLKSNEYFLKLNINRTAFNIDNFREFMDGTATDQNKHCFYDLTKQYLKKVPLSAKRAGRYTALIATLKSNFRSLFVEDIGFEFLHASLAIFQTQCGNSKNTSYDKAKMILAILHYAEKLEIKISKSIGFFKTEYAESERDFITIDEMKFFTTWLDSDKLQPYHKNVLRYYLFACYTGLRYSDVKKVASDQARYIRNNTVSAMQVKTNKPVSVPLSEKPLELLKNGCLDIVYCSRRTNSYLKKICEISEFGREITFHSARHSFATNSISLGIPIEVIQRCLGHTEIATTQIYAKIVDKVKQENIAKWNTI